MIFVVLRVVIVAVALWILWRLCTALFSTRRAPSTRTQKPDEWSEVLEAIDELPETTDPQLHTQKSRQPLQPQPFDGTASHTSIEAVMTHEAETALSRIRERDENQRLAAYYELSTYHKLCCMENCHISEPTRRAIDAMYRQAREIICPPEKS